MHLLIFSPWSYSTDYYTAKFCNALIDKNIKVSLIAPENFLFKLLNPKIEIIDWGYIASEKTTIKDLLQTPFQCLKLISIIKKTKHDWLHILWLHHVPALLSLFLRKYNIAYTVHDPILHQGEAGFLRSFIQKRLIKLSKIKFVHGEENKQALINNYNLFDKNIVNIPHGEFVFWEKGKFNVKQEKIILFFGRVRQYKGLDILLKSFKKIQDKIPGYQLYIVGQGDISKYYEEIKSLKNIVVINRYIEHDEAAEIILKCSFAVLPYIQATQSGVIPMMFALERTCIASNVGAIPESIENYKNGILVQPSNINELAEKILLLASDTNLREKLQKNAYESIHKSASFSWEKTSEICSSIYNSVKKH